MSAAFLRWLRQLPSRRERRYAVWRWLRRWRRHPRSPVRPNLQPGRAAVIERGVQTL